MHAQVVLLTGRILEIGLNAFERPVRVVEHAGWYVPDRHKTLGNGVLRKQAARGNDVDQIEWPLPLLPNRRPGLCLGIEEDAIARANHSLGIEAIGKPYAWPDGTIIGVPAGGF